MNYTDMNKTQQHIVDFYLDYFNNYLTIAKIAEHRGISIELATSLINEGRLLNNKDPQHLNSII